MQSNGMFLTYVTNGSVALKPKATQFTVYEGGLNQQARNLKPTSRESHTIKTKFSSQVLSAIIFALTVTLFVGAVLCVDTTAAMKRTAGFDSVQTQEISAMKNT